jgi:hypothetical protein
MLGWALEKELSSLAPSLTRPALPTLRAAADSSWKVRAALLEVHFTALRK